MTAQISLIPGQLAAPVIRILTMSSGIRLRTQILTEGRHQADTQLTSHPHDLRGQAIQSVDLIPRTSHRETGNIRGDWNAHIRYREIDRPGDCGYPFEVPGALGGLTSEESSQHAFLAGLSEPNDGLGVKGLSVDYSPRIVFDQLPRRVFTDDLRRGVTACR